MQYRTRSDVPRLYCQDVMAPGFETGDSQTRAPFHCTASPGKPCCPSPPRRPDISWQEIEPPFAQGEQCAPPRVVSAARALLHRSLLQRQRLPELTPDCVSSPSAKLLTVAAAQCDLRGQKTHTHTHTHNHKTTSPHPTGSSQHLKFPRLRSSGDLCSCYYLYQYKHGPSGKLGAETKKRSIVLGKGEGDGKLSFAREEAALGRVGCLLKRWKLSMKEGRIQKGHPLFS